MLFPNWCFIFLCAAKYDGWRWRWNVPINHSYGKEAPRLPNNFLAVSKTPPDRSFGHKWNASFVTVFNFFFCACDAMQQDAAESYLLFTASLNDRCLCQSVPWCWWRNYFHAVNYRIYSMKRRLRLNVADGSKITNKRRPRINAAPHLQKNTAFTRG